MELGKAEAVEIIGEIDNWLNRIEDESVRGRVERMIDSVMFEYYTADPVVFLMVAGIIASAFAKVSAKSLK